MKYKKLPFEEYTNIFHKVPRVAIDIVVRTPKGILLTLRVIHPYKGMWHLPGGGVLFREPIKHAIDRIISEELGIKVKVIKPLGIIEYLNDGERHAVTNVFLTEIIKGAPRGSEQGKEIGYFKEIPDNCIPEQREFLRKFLAAKE